MEAHRPMPNITDIQKLDDVISLLLCPLLPFICALLISQALNSWQFLLLRLNLKFNLTIRI